MSFRWTGLATALLMAGSLAMVAPGCVVHATARTATVVDEPPPEPRYRNPAPRQGYVWIQGRWVYRSGDWHWQDGRWERERSGQVYEPGRWERRGDRYHWVEGRWVSRQRTATRASRGQSSSDPVVRDHRTPQRDYEAVPAERGRSASQPANEPKVRDHRTQRYPTSAPPSKRRESPGTRSGYVWISGHYKWESGQYVWQDGYWERARANRTWQDGHWERQGDRYVWVEGRWVDAPADRGPRTRDRRQQDDGPAVRDHRR
jgi:hypothetical protein